MRNMSEDRDSLSDENNRKNALLAKLASTEVVVWSPQTDRAGIQALSELLVAAKAVANDCDGGYLKQKNKLFAQESVDSLYAKILDFQSSKQKD